MSKIRIIRADILYLSITCYIALVVLSVSQCFDMSCIF